MTRASTLHHWESYWHRHPHSDESYSTGERLAREILADGAVAGATVLEVGAGSGRDTLGLVRAGACGVVLDYSPASLALVRARARSQGLAVQLVRADALATPFRDGAFAVVFHQGLLEHFSDEAIYKLLDEQLRVAKFVVLSVPNNLYPKQDFGDERLMSKEEWENLLSKKYQIVESFEYNPFTQIILGGRFIRKIFNTMYLAKIKRN